MATTKIKKTVFKHSLEVELSPQELDVVYNGIIALRNDILKLHGKYVTKWHENTYKICNELVKEFRIAKNSIV